MRQGLIILTVILQLLFLGSNSFAATHKIIPNMGYRLTFDVDGNVEEARWAIYLRDANGYLPFDGVLEGDWQVLKPGKKSYTHLFYSPSDVATLDLKILS